MCAAPPPPVGQVNYHTSRRGGRRPPWVEGGRRWGEELVGVEMGGEELAGLEEGEEVEEVGGGRDRVWIGD